MKVLISTGGTLGHIIPAIDLANTLAKENNNILILSNKIDTLIEYITTNRNIRIKRLPMLPPSRTKLFSLKNLKFISSLSLSLILSFFYILQFRPNLVLGMGSYASLAPLILAWISRIRIILHEQNIIPGMVNRLFSKVADEIIVYFKPTQNYFPNCKSVIVSNPVEKRRKINKQKACEFFGLSKDRFTILIFGGSQGASSINRVTTEVLPKLLTNYKVQFIFITGKDNKINIPQNPYIYLTDFISPWDMDYAYSAADLVISRSGACTIAEIMYFKLPAILIPYPYATSSHQLKNAQFLENYNPCIIIKDEDLSGEVLLSSIIKLLSLKEFCHKK
jgi:UDP-N-acetylglucosamine--N-acetylmuramyl-(pentapeptide) pyrophosphoryl-undecaprenol N-acetylglucosamine transferase